MAEYHYQYDPSTGGQNRNSSGNDDLGTWIAIVVLFAVGIWPLALFLLIRKLLGSSSGERRDRVRRPTRQAPSQTGTTYRYTYTRNPNAAAPAAPRQPAAPAPAPAAPRQAAAPQAAAPSVPKKKPLPGRGLLVGGGILTGVFGFSLAVVLADAFASYALRDAFPALTALAGFTGIGLVLLYTGLSQRKRAKLQRKYLGLIGRRESVSISTLAKAAGRDYRRVCDELQDMLDSGVLPMGYLDLANDKLVLTSQGIADEPAPVVEDDDGTDDNDILVQIRAVNDSIPDPVMSAKIDRIGEITGKILDYQRKNPAKAGQLRSFLNYYLPTTLKILRAYAQLGEQGVEGENISSAKQRIEGMMDKVVEGFEKQLDKLFQDDALDITTDVAVLEKMLDNDGLGQGGLTLGA